MRLPVGASLCAKLAPPRPAANHDQIEMIIQDEPRGRRAEIGARNINAAGAMEFLFS